MAALFGQSGDGRREPKSLVEFRAGKMRLNNRVITADVRKGLVYMKMEDGLLHFCWKDRKSGKVEDDLTIFPGDAEIKRVPQCTTGRVLLLKFSDSTSRRFYWMQEPREEKDSDYLKKVNDLINHPPDPSSTAGDGMGGAHGLPPGLLAGVPESQLQSLLAGAGGGGRGMDQQQLLELLGSGLPPGIGGMLAPFDGVGRGGAGSSGSMRPPSSSSTTPTLPSVPDHQPHSRPPPRAQPPAQPPQSRQVMLGELQNILSSMNIPSSQQEDTPAASEDGVNLSEVVTSDVLRPLSASPEARDQLAPLLPPTQEPGEVVLTSPQFRQALGLFGSALQSGQLGPLMTQFGLSSNVAQAASTGDVSGFAAALQEELDGDAQQPSQGGEDGGEGKEKEEEDGEKRQQTE